MSDPSTQPWFNRVFNFEQPLHCPRCDARFAIGPLFDHDPHVCLTCNTTLIEWNMLSVVYLIDKDRAPDIVQALINHLQTLGEPAAFNQLLALLQFLHVEEITSLYDEL